MRPKFRIVPFFALLLLLGNLPDVGGASPKAPVVYRYRLLPRRSRISFVFREFVVPFVGHFGVLKGTLSLKGGGTLRGSSAKVRIEAASVAAKNAEQTSMLRSEVLEVHRYPFIDVEINSVRMLGRPRRRGREKEYRLRVEGKVRMHGVERKISLPVRLSDTGTVLYVTAKTTILLSDYNMARPRVLLLVPGEDFVEVNVRLVAEPAPRKGR